MSWSRLRRATAARRVPSGVGRRPRVRHALVIPVAVGVLFAATGCMVPPKALTVSTVVGGLANPWDLAFAPDGTMLYTERAGRIDVLAGGTTRVLAAPTDVLVASEAGMMGLAVDPDFTVNRRIYTCFASTVSGGNDIRVVRWTVNAGYTALANRADILVGIPVNNTGQVGRHAGCRTRFGPDRMLWVTTGDAAINTTPQNKQGLGGKVLRITTDGTGAPGNPGGALRPEIYTYGHRNPQGVAWRPSDGQAFSVEHGTGCDDEVNELQPGANYGWDPVPPGGGTLYDESRPMTDHTKFPTAIDAVWSSGCPTIAPSGATFLSGAQWSGWANAMAIAVLKGQQLRVFKFYGPGDSQRYEWTRITDQGRLRVAVQGPDGNLYLAQDKNPGAILKVVPTPA